ncbi:hypothetical protein P7H62_14315 [Vagococcus carniphilus]|uniref:hypothetical protein n=1 Tax=Vagococcus carniphilus TaxID=218144 RepID=UPI00288EC516|nr:hypothetical protein [Vagococcus carniphilus]MDT2830040.1 hypothetical protein [Vagococcus carniphilus]MDT2838474.1 hypothetical protein [Vagococcus carniphilus]MDT2855636.1 hypothetical protein [Vagococcus carniphilus]
MTEQVSFSPEVKKVTNKSNGNTEVLLVISNSSLKGKADDLNEFLGKTVNIMIVPENYSYTVPFDKSVDKPTMEYKVFADGTVQLVKQEQTQLDVDGKGNVDIVQKSFSVDKEVIDEYILNAGSFSFPGEVNPREVLQQLAQGVSMSEIAAELEFSESALINELEKARRELAPFADAWKKANASGNVLPVEETEKVKQDKTVDTSDVADDSVSENKNDEKRNTEEEVEEPSETVEVGEDDGEADPY